tara:strand:- start:529 stop:1695 length:1167 start_codon:yes stop_codon:yes gene_type:complete
LKLTCSQTELNSALQLVSRAVASRPTHPVLANILLTADASTGRLSFTGFDLSLGMQVFISATVDKSGAITLPSRLFGEIISKLSSESPITIESDELGDQVELRSKSGTYQVRGMPSDEFPDLPLVKSGKCIEIKPDVLVNALRSTLFASSADEAKQLLTGVHLTFIGTEIEAAATDGHRLAVLNLPQALNSSIDKNDDDIENNDKFSITLPARSLRELEKFIINCKTNELINLFYDQGQVVFMAADQIVTSRTLDGTYPNYMQLIPENFSNKLEFNRKNFINSLERIAVLADQHNNIVKLTTDISSKLVNISADAQDIGSASESLPVKITGEIDQIAFNVRYLLDGLRVIDSENISLKCNTATTPAIFSPSEENNKFIYLVMPVQIRL